MLSKRSKEVRKKALELSLAAHSFQGPRLLVLLRTAPGKGVQSGTGGTPAP